MEEGNRPHSLYPECNMFLPLEEINHRHPTTELFTRGAERKKGWLEEEEARVGVVMAFQEYGQPLERVMLFKYLGCLLTATNYECEEVIIHPQKYQEIWSRMSQILVQ